MTDEEAILATLEEYSAAYCAKDVDRLMAIFADGDDISLIGTGADELCSGRDQVRTVFERNFAEATALNFRWFWKHLTITDTSAAVAINLIIDLKTDSGILEIPIRWTVALVKNNGRWLWVHRHASAAAGSQDKGTAYPTK